MKNLYLYGAQEDFHEIETDFGLACESVNDILIFNRTGALIAHYEFEYGNWGIQLVGEIPKDWIVRAIEGNAPPGFNNWEDAGQFIHIQIPDEETIKLTPMGEVRGHAQGMSAFNALNKN